GETAVAQDSGIMDQDMDAAEIALGMLDHRFDFGRIGDAGVARDRSPAAGADFVDDLRGGAAAAAAVTAAAKIVYDQGCAATRELERIGAPEAAAGAGHDRDPAF